MQSKHRHSRVFHTYEICYSLIVCYVRMDVPCAYDSTDRMHFERVNRIYNGKNSELNCA